MPQTSGSAVASPAQAQGVANIVTLRTQLSELNIQATALRATSRGLRRQLDGMRLDNPARPAVQQQSADVGAQLAQVEGRIAEVQARLAQAQGVSVDRISETGTLAPPPPPFRRGPDPDMIVGMTFALAICIALPLSIAYARRLWRGKPPQHQPSSDRLDDVVQRLGRLELGVDSIAIEIERISEGQRFVTKVFADRPVQQQPQSPPPEAANKPALGEGQPPLRALGAGPVEAVHVNNAEAVKDRVKYRPME
jgi:hypothetical protein